MELLIPVVAILLAIPALQNQNIEDFSRFSKSVGQQISLVDSHGVVREGLLAAATADAVKMQFAGGEKSFSRAEVMSAERLHEGTVDGAMKGAILGFVMVALASQGTRNEAEAAKVAWISVAVYSGVGWAIDAAQTHRPPIYRAALPQPGVKMSLRF